LPRRAGGEEWGTGVGVVEGTALDGASEVGGFMAVLGCRLMAWAWGHDEALRLMLVNVT